MCGALSGANPASLAEVIVDANSATFEDNRSVGARQIAPETAIAQGGSNKWTLATPGGVRLYQMPCRETRSDGIAR